MGTISKEYQQFSVAELEQVLKSPEFFAVAFNSFTRDVDGIDNNLESTNSAVVTNAANIVTNTTNISTNASGISTNAANIGNNPTSITTNATNITTNATSITTNATSITTNATNLTNHEADTTAHGATGNIVGDNDFAGNLVGGVVLESALVNDGAASTVAVTSADATDLPSTITLVNEIKGDVNQLVTDLNAVVTQFNDLLAKLKTAKQMSTT